MGLFLPEWACILKSKIKAKESRHHLWSIDLSQILSELIMSIFMFYQYYFQYDLLERK